jgi:aminoglycoside 6-adenylyltransferase
MEELLGRIVRWAEGCPDIRAMILIGSRARQDRPADEWSDLDFVLAAVDEERYFRTTAWLDEIGAVWLTCLEGTVVGSLERRVLFEGALDVDFNFFAPEKFRQVLRDAAAASWTRRRGTRVLLDRDGLVPPLPAAEGEKPAARPPDEAEFLNAVHDFWYHAVWTAKKLRRGELFIAKGCCDSYMKRLVRQMIEWHARATHGWEYDTWHDGRFLDQWADPRAVAGLQQAYAHYDPADLQRALFVTMELFRWLALEVAGRLGYAYPAEGGRRAAEWVQRCLAEGQP